MRVFITGAAGLIGAAICRTLTGAGHPVTGGDLTTANQDAVAQTGARFRPIDITEPSTLKDALQGHDACVHCAALFDFGLPWPIMEEVNVAGTNHLFAACSRAGVRRVVHLSTVGVYGRPRRVPCRENDPKHPRTVYEKTKWLSEQAAWRLALDHQIDLTVLRPSLVYGPGAIYGPAMFVALFAALRFAYERKSFPVLATGPSVNAVHVDDVAAAVAFALEKPATIGEAFNVAEPEHFTVGDLGRALAEAFGMAPRPALPYIPLLWKWTTSGIAMIPPSVAGRWDRAISARWNVLRDRHALAPSFRPRLETDWMHYMSADHVFDSSKLRGLGFRFREDNFLRSVPRLVDWYEANRFIPPRGV